MMRAVVLTVALACLALVLFSACDSSKSKTEDILNDLMGIRNAQIGFKENNKSFAPDLKTLGYTATGNGLKWADFKTSADGKAIAVVKPAAELPHKTITLSHDGTLQYGD